MQKKKLSKRPLNVQLIQNCRELFKTRKAIEDLMMKCEEISSTMEGIVEEIAGKTTKVNHSVITDLPKYLNPEYAFFYLF